MAADVVVVWVLLAVGGVLTVGLAVFFLIVLRDRDDGSPDD